MDKKPKTSKPKRSTKNDHQKDINETIVNKVNATINLSNEIQKQINLYKTTINEMNIETGDLLISSLSSLELSLIKSNSNLETVLFDIKNGKYKSLDNYNTVESYHINAIRIINKIQSNGIMSVIKGYIGSLYKLEDKKIKNEFFISLDEAMSRINKVYERGAHRKSITTLKRKMTINAIFNCVSLNTTYMYVHRAILDYLLNEIIEKYDL